MSNNSSFQPNKTLLEQLNVDELQAMTLLISQIMVDSVYPPETPCVKPHFRHIWKFFIFIYSIVGVLGAAGNIYMITVMLAETNFRRFVNYLLLNLSLCDIFKCLVVLPLTLCVLLLKHWWFGVTMCYLLPVLQMFPVVVSMVTYVLIALNRYFLVFHSSNRALSRKIYLFMMVAVWVCCMCLALPLKVIYSIRKFELKFTCVYYPLFSGLHEIFRPERLFGPNDARSRIVRCKVQYGHSRNEFCFVYRIFRYSHCRYGLSIRQDEHRIETSTKYTSEES